MNVCFRLLRYHLFRVRIPEREAGLARTRQDLNGEEKHTCDSVKILARFNFVAFFIIVKEADSYKYSPSRLTLYAYNFLRTQTEDKRHTNVFIMYTKTTFSDNMTF